MHPRWLDWAQRLQAISQTGLAFAGDPYDIERYEAIRVLAAEIMAAHSDTNQNYIQGMFANEAGYATPKVDVRGAVFRDDTILLVKERSDGGWTLPGGWADVGDSPSDAIVREIVEESGYQTRAVKLLALYDRNKHAHPPYPYHAYKLFFLCQLIGGTPTQSIETEDVAFFRRDALPPLSLTRITAAQIARLFDHHDHPDWPTDFD